MRPALAKTFAYAALVGVLFGAANASAVPMLSNTKNQNTNDVMLATRRSALNPNGSSESYWAGS